MIKLYLGILLDIYFNMTIFEPVNRVEVSTPKGKGFIWLITEYGTETSKLFTVIQDNGEIWEWQPKDIKVLQNTSFNRLNTNSL
jgi:hypothetical protein